MTHYNIICSGNGPRCLDRYFDPKGDKTGWIDIKRCGPCDDGKTPEAREDRERYERNKRAEIRRKYVGC